jgi:hypothetical protein
MSSDERRYGNPNPLLERGDTTMEKMINDIKIIETEDGFRVEIKGDKEAIRRMLSGFGFCGSPRTDASSVGGFNPCSDFMSGFASWCGSWEKTKGKSQSA